MAKRPDKIHRLAIDYLAANASVTRPTTEALRAAVEEAFPGSIARVKERRRKESFERKFTGRTPEWVKRFVKKHGDGVVRSVTIRQSRTKTYSSGHCMTDGSIVVTFGAGRMKLGPDGLTPADPAETLVEQQATVLHEIAHALHPWRGHEDVFYAEWRKLLAAEGILRAAIATGRFGPMRAAKLKRAASRR